jgi:hypothetical protein
MVFFMMVLVCYSAQAQSKQVRLYLKQIAANKAFIEWIQKGYKIARTGLTTIGDIKNGEFSLHKDFFGSLRSVNPRIKNAAIVADIVAYQYKIVQTYSRAMKHLRASVQFKDAEVRYINSVFSKLLDDTARNLDDLTTLLTADQYQMSDDERIKRINAVHAEMKSNYVFAQRFGNQALVMAVQRQQEGNEVGNSRLLNGIK